MHLISLEGSERQKSKLRNGHKVRIRRGAGFNVVVSPNTYHLVSRAFNKNKGVQIQLSPEEIAMNKAPSPELQAQIMGHNEHMILPNTDGALVKGSGIGDWFKNVGNQIKSGFEDKIINPIKQNIIQPVQDVYNKYVPEDTRRDINTGLKFSSPLGLVSDLAKRLSKGEKIQDIGRGYYSDLRHLNDTKNKIIKSSPVLTDAYKKGVMATAGLGSAALGSAFGLSPVTGALVGAAGTEGGKQLLKAEGYGLHHAIEAGERHHYHELKHMARPIGGALKWSHITNFFKHAGHAIKSAMPVVQKGANMAHNFLLNNPKLAEKVKQHGSKLAGTLAKLGVNYLSGNEKYGDQAEQMGSKLASEQIHNNLGYGLYSGGGGLYAGQRSGGGLHNNAVVDTRGQPKIFGPKMSNGNRTTDTFNVGSPFLHGNMQGHGFDSFSSIHAMNAGTALANAHLGGLNHRTIEGQIHQEPIRKYWDGEGEPPSRGTGIHPHHHSHIHSTEHLHNRGRGFGGHDHYNLMGGRGRLLEHSASLPIALVSQPYGSNFHMQFQLPPEYHKYNDGTYTF